VLTAYAAYAADIDDRGEVDAVGAEASAGVRARVAAVLAQAWDQGATGERLAVLTRLTAVAGPQ
jgi:hypothetical protein